MAHLSIIGTGTMGQAIAALAGRGGHTVQLLGSDDTSVAVTGDIVVLAVPYPAVPAVLDQRGASLTGKVVVCVGGEHEGLRRLTRETCDRVIGLPMRGRVESLNLATAAAAVLYEAVRQRTAR